MKKFVFRAVSVVFSILLLTTGLLFAQAAGRTGDVDGDGSINSADALAVLQHSVGSRIITGQAAGFADVNKDGEINSADALGILSLTVGVIKDFSEIQQGVTPPDVPRLNGKKILFFGDSIFANSRNSKTSIPKLVCNSTGATAYNFAISGTMAKPRSEGSDFQNKKADCWGALEGERLIEAVTTGNWDEQVEAARSLLGKFGVTSYGLDRVEGQMKDFDYSDIDIFIFNWATNDFGAGRKLSSWSGSVRNIVSMLQKSFPHAKIVMCSATQRFWVDDNGVVTGDGNTHKVGGSSAVLRDFVNEGQNIADSLNIPYVNLYNLGINKDNYTEYLVDRTHPAEPARILIAQRITQEINH